MNGYNYETAKNIYASEEGMTQKPIRSQSPVDKEIESLSKRMEAIECAFSLFVDRLNPILRPIVISEKGKDQACRPVGESDLHERLIQLNEQASHIDSAVSRSADRITV